jgi:hypothetical protein
MAPNTTPTTALASKSLFRSKTFWLNVAALTVAALTGLLDAQLIQDNPQIVSVIMGAIAVLNVLLRTITTKPTHLVVLLVGLLLTAGPATAQTVRIMSAQAYDEISRLLPRVSDERVQAAIESPDTVWWSEQEVPRAYQNHDAVGGFHWVGYNISGGLDPAGNAGREFPWRHAAGTGNVRNLRELRFLSLPAREDGSRWPVVTWWENLPYDAGEHLRWRYPTGTIVGELLLEQDERGKWWCFEVRIREREPGEWGCDSFWPIPNAESLAAHVPGYTAQVDGEQHVGNHHPYRTVIDVRAKVSVLPELPADQVRALLDRPFESRLLGRWQGEIVAPRSNQTFGLFPAGYRVEAIEVRRESCNRCHHTTLMHTNQFDHPGRDWYGRVPGDDTVFATPMLDPRCVSSTGATLQPRFRESFLRAGFIEPFDRAKHPTEIYPPIPELEANLYGKR